MKIRRYIILLTGLLSVIIFITNLWAATAPFIDDMESGTNGWTVEVLSPSAPPSLQPEDWSLGTPSGGGAPVFPTPPPLTHPSRTNCWGTNIDVGNGNYKKNRNIRLVSPQIDLGLSPQRPFLSVYIWYKIADQIAAGQNGDYAYIEVNRVGTTWDDDPLLDTISRDTPNQSMWLKKTYELSGYTGNIQVGFRLSSDNKFEDLGLYIDDVAVGTNLDTRNRYIIALEPESTPVSTSGTTNNMTVRVELRDLFRFIDSDPSLDGTPVTLQGIESNPNGTLDPPSSSSTLSSGKTSFTFTNTEGEEVTFTPSVTISGQNLTSISTIGKFLSPFRKSWEEKE